MKKFPWGHEKRYNDFSSYFKRQFSGRVQKIAIDAGFTCPNRDGTKSVGGCTYCNNNTFNPFYCNPDKSISKQLSEGIQFFSEKYKAQKYLAYFQAYSNTYRPLSELKKIYQEALSVDGVIGLVIATRPDCINEEILDYLQFLAEDKYILIEYGIESCSDITLANVNRAHTFDDSVKALENSAGRNIQIGVHYILGLPGDNRKDNINHAKILADLPFDHLKLHQLQIIKETVLAKQYSERPEQFQLFGLEEYIDHVIRFAEYLRPEIIIERFISEAPKELLIAPKWGGIKNFEITAMIQKRFNELNSRQSKHYLG
jgi:radical SAM protein (TIGR01212 family)